MSDPPLGALSSLGWDDRAAAGFAEIAAPGLVPARVVRVERSASVIATASGEYLARTPGVAAVGDWVAAHVGEGGTDVSVVAFVPAWSQLTRTGPGGEPQVLAANVDLVFVTAPADRLTASRVEREAAMAFDGGARPVVLVTKADLASPGQIDELETRLGHVEVIATSVRTGAGLAAIRQALQPCRTAALLGPSGAGKSSMANVLVGAERMATSEVREGDRRGRHTTTWRQLLVVPTGGVLVDTPGLRSLSMTGMGAGIAAAFDDVAALAESCRFRDCSHLREPGCAVRAAVAAGRLDAARLANYLKLQGEMAAEEVRADPPPRRPAPGASRSRR